MNTSNKPKSRKHRKHIRRERIDHAEELVSISFAPIAVLLHVNVMDLDEVFIVNAALIEDEESEICEMETKMRQTISKTANLERTSLSFVVIRYANKTTKLPTFCNGS
jgi:hypothetical protein